MDRNTCAFCKLNVITTKPSKLTDVIISNDILLLISSVNCEALKKSKILANNAYRRRPLPPYVFPLSNLLSQSIYLFRILQRSGTMR